MIFEIATFTIKRDRTDDFEAGAARAAAIFGQAEGCRSFEVNRSIEEPSRYRLIVGWDSVEHHTVTFRQSEGYAQWRQLVGDCFAEPPQVEHVTKIVDGL